MESWGIARALHVAGVVLWIGGVAMVTLVLLPAVRRMRGSDALEFFEAVEHGFARQTRWTLVLVGATGLYLTYALDLWNRFADLRYWWMHAMVLIWTLFALMLFVLEPFFVHRWFAARARRDPQRTVKLAQRVHWVLLGLSMVTILGAVAGAHGVFLF